jgi:hypothetical protein
MTRDEIYKQVSTPVARHPVLEAFEVRAEHADAEALSKVDLCAVSGSKYRFDYVETSLVLPNEVVTPEFVTGWWYAVTPIESFAMWGAKLVVNGRTIQSFSPSGCSGGDPHRLDRPILLRPGAVINVFFEGPTVKPGRIAFKLYGFEVAYSVLPDFAHFAAAS